MAKLNKKQKYLQIALNSTLEEAKNIISQLPLDKRIIIEAGTPLIKNYGVEGIKTIRNFWNTKVLENFQREIKTKSWKGIFRVIKEEEIEKAQGVAQTPYIVADLKCMDRGKTEVRLAKEGGASAATVLGCAPLETINAFVEECKKLGLDSMIDMMNVEYPLSILRELKQLPDVVILHRGVDEEDYNPEKELPFYEIQRIKSQYDIMVAVAGGDTIQEIQTAVFNDVDIVVVWRNFYKSSKETAKLAREFLKEIR